MSAKNLLQLLEDKGLLEESAMRDLKKQMSEKKVNAATIAKALVDKGMLTKYQATQLVGEATAASDKSEHLEEKPVDELKADETVMLEDAGGITGLTPVEDAGAALTPVPAPQPVAAQSSLEPLDGLESLDPMGGGLETLDSFGSMDGGLDPTGSPDATPAQAATKGKKKREKKNHQDWGGKLMIGGGGLLLFLIVAGLLLWYNLGRIGPIELFDHAETQYKEGTYSGALADYGKLVERFPSDENADKARVQIALCNIRIILKDPDKGYAAAMEHLPQVETLPPFGAARDELPGIFVEITEGYTNKAKSASDMATKEEFVKKAEKAFADLIDQPKWVPASKRKAIEADIKRIQEDIKIVNREINRDRELAKTLDVMQQHIDAGETESAYAAYKKLLADYVGLRENPDLVAMVKAITGAEKARVKVGNEELAAATADHKSTSEFRVVLATKTGEAIPRLANQPVAVQAGGSVYGLDAGSGTVSWRRYVGYGTQHQPATVSSTPKADLIVSDMQRLEVSRLNAATGKLAWRLPIGEEFGAPAIAGDNLYVTTASGKILKLDTATGNSSLQVTVPQTLDVAAGVAQSHPYLLQPGHHSNLYVLSTETMECVEVEYLGHREGTIAVPPLVVQDHILIAENISADTCRLHIRKILPNSEDGELLKRTQDPIMLKGNIRVPMTLYGRRPLMVTDKGEINVFNVDFNAEEDTVEHAAKPNPTRETRMLSYPVVEGTTLVVADEELVKYDLQVTKRTIRRVKVTNSDEAFVAPPLLLGDILIVTRRLKGSTGATVSALNVDDPRTGVWTTHLSVPVGRAAVAGRKLDVVTAGGSQFDVDANTLKAGYSSTPTATANAPGSLSFTKPVVFENGKVAFFNPADTSRALVHSPGGGARSLRVVTLNLAGAKVTCTPRAFKDGLLTPADNGSVVLANTSNGANLVLPFQPKLGPGEDVQWRRPAIVGDEFVIIDDRRNIYRVGIKDTPQPHLSALATAQLDVNVDSELAAVGDIVYGIIRNSGGDVLVTINAADLTIAKEFALKGQAKWGPVQVGDVIFVLSDADGLLCFADGEQRWAQASGLGDNPAGPPLAVGDDYVFALLKGTVVRLSGSDGKLLANTTVGEPLGNGPVAFNSLLLLPGHDGSLHVIRTPEPQAATPDASSTEATGAEGS